MILDIFGFSEIVKITIGDYLGTQKEILMIDIIRSEILNELTISTEAYFSGPREYVIALATSHGKSIKIVTSEEELGRYIFKCISKNTDAHYDDFIAQYPESAI